MAEAAEQQRQAALLGPELHAACRHAAASEGRSADQQGLLEACGLLLQAAQLLPITGRAEAKAIVARGPGGDARGPPLTAASTKDALRALALLARADLVAPAPLLPAASGQLLDLMAGNAAWLLHLTGPEAARSSRGAQAWQALCRVLSTCSLAALFQPAETAEWAMMAAMEVANEGGRRQLAAQLQRLYAGTGQRPPLALDDLRWLCCWRLNKAAGAAASSPEQPRRAQEAVRLAQAQEVAAACQPLLAELRPDDPRSWAAQAWSGKAAAMARLAAGDAQPMLALMGACRRTASCAQRQRSSYWHAHGAAMRTCMTCVLLERQPSARQRMRGRGLRALQEELADGLAAARACAAELPRQLVAPVQQLCAMAERTLRHLMAPPAQTAAGASSPAASASRAPSPSPGNNSGAGGSSPGATASQVPAAAAAAPPPPPLAPLSSADPKPPPPPPDSQPCEACGSTEAQPLMCFRCRTVRYCK